ncbi:MAG: glucose-1-phosphate adenylyltransferase subunit GlgD, partial [Clostridia bacterium]|nr:glucose-1-phosphate adenylyltransferase subunit GlgD [Clostridia bacterium]
MRDYMAILNLAENENDIRALTTNRPIASIPIGSRYRVVDFMLSNLVNAGVRNVGVFTESNSRSLADHLGTGKPWDLNRKIDGLFLFNHGLCNLMYTDSKLIKNNMEYIYRSK